MSPLSSAAAIAIRLASSSPQAKLPCPVCAASVKGQNFEKHLRKAHPGVVPELGERLVWRGVDRASFYPSLVPLVLATLGFTAFAVNTPTYGDATAIGVIVALLASLVLPLLVATNQLRANLVLEGDELRLSYALGLLQRTIRVRGPLQVGTRWERRPQAGHPMPEHFSEDVRAGQYIRFVDGSAGIIVGIKGGTGLRSHWDPVGWRNGPSRRHWHITLEPSEMAALELHLAHLGVLTPRQA